MQQPPPALPVLYADALVSVFQFLDLRGLNAALCVSRLWHSVVLLRMPSAGLGLRHCSLHRLRQVGPSPLARHVGRFSLSEESTAGDVRILAGPNWSDLHALSCRLDMRQPQEWLLPPSLRELGLPESGGSAEGRASVLEAIAQLKLLKAFTCHVEVCEPLLVCLPRLSSLRSLSLPRPFRSSEELKLRFLDCCRQLPQLRVLHVACLVPADVTYLLRPGHQLQQLQELDRFNGLDNPIAALLPSLPALRKVKAWKLKLTSFAFVGQMPHLCELSLALYSMLPKTRAALLFSSAAGHFARITRLTLSAGGLPSDEIALLLAGMPQLSRLTLHGWQTLRSLRFLATAQLAASLTALHLSWCDALPLEELEHLHGLKRLRSLIVHQSFIVPLPAEVRCLFTPGDSALLLPQLAEFQYRPPHATVAAAAQ